MRRRLIVGNWKMHKTATEAAVLVRRLSDLVPEPGQVEVVIAPPFTALHAAARALPASPSFALAAQNLHWEDEGPFTGEISAHMLKDLGCRYVILGHSERRQLFGEDDEAIKRKVRASLRHRLGPILCVGESLSDHKKGRTEIVVTAQLRKALDGISQDEIRLVTIAYEPVWAIGTGHAASPAQAGAVHETLRGALAKSWGAEAGEQVRILYGGSVTAENAGEFLASSRIDGALVGGACLDPQSFATIIAVAQKAAR